MMESSTIPQRKLTFPSNGWNTALLGYIANEEAYSDEILQSTSQALLITDKYPKVCASLLAGIVFHSLAGASKNLWT